MISRITRFRKVSLEKRRTHIRHEIDPDEVLLDASNLPDFDTDRFEGRLERPIKQRDILAVFLVFVLIALTFVGRLWKLEVKDGALYFSRSENNRLRHDVIFANRGIITDRFNENLVWNEPRDNEIFPKRAYTARVGFGHLLGYVSYPKRDSAGFYYQDHFIGKEGLESLYDEALSGTNGLELTETDAKGAIESQSAIAPPVNGMKLTLSIDARLQEKMYQYIKIFAEKYKFNGGAGAIMDIHTGELLALTSYPEYSSDALSSGDSKLINSYNTDKRTPFLNRAVGGLYTPGSIVKPFVALGALTENIIDPAKKILSTGQIEVQNPYKKDEKTIFRDWKAHGLVDMRQAIAVSSDVYFYEVGGGYEGQKGLGIANIEKYFSLFGFGKLTGLDLGDEKEGNIPSPEWKADNFNGEPWRLGDTYHTAIGQYGMLVTPLQIVRAYAAIANNGTLLTPRLIKAEANEKVTGEKLDMSPQYLQIIHEGMRQSVLMGTASGLNTSVVKIAGKTGTAELGITKDYVNSWTTGYFPYENPKYAYVILMEHGSRHNTVWA
jgi:penicillin-binding protein 2